VLADEEIVAAIRGLLAKRPSQEPQPRSLGRLQVLRLLVQAYPEPELWRPATQSPRQLVYCSRIGRGKVPDAKTVGKWGMALGPQVLRQNEDSAGQ
jgi:IS5 family transposase